MARPSVPADVPRGWGARCDPGAPLGAGIVALVALLLVVPWLDVGGDYPRMGTGPGLTVDEPFNVEQGWFLFEAYRSFGLAALHPETSLEIHGHERILPDHPPLGRLLIGVCHTLFTAVCPPGERPTPVVITAGRTGSAVAFALLAVLVARFASRRFGPVAGWSAAASLVLMPHVFGHAHLAALETTMNLTWAAAVLSVAATWRFDDEGPSRRTVLGTGVLFGLALLTKMQAVFLPVPIAAWALWCGRKRAIVPLLVWGIAGFVVFFLGWPWLWLDPVAHLKEYFARSTQRAVLHVFYLGQSWADRDVPWHFPFVEFATSVPVGLHLLAAWGLTVLKRADDPQRAAVRREMLLVLAALVVPLLVFAVPGIAVYDGTRLFLVVFPLEALFVGIGAAKLRDVLVGRCERRGWSARWATGALIVCLALQSWGTLRTGPCRLSYRNLLVGGPAGAERLGFEATYWGDSLTRDVLAEMVRLVPPGSTVALVPTLHAIHVDELANQSPILRRHGVKIVAPPPSGDAEATGSQDAHVPAPQFVLWFRRRADVPPAGRADLAGLVELPDGTRPATRLAEWRTCGVLLAALDRWPTDRSGEPAP